MKKIPISEENLKFFNISTDLLLAFLNSYHINDLILIVRPSDTLYVYTSKLNNTSLTKLRYYFEYCVFPKNSHIPTYLNTNITNLW